jgi:hypothetical protein
MLGLRNGPRGRYVTMPIFTFRFAPDLEVTSFEPYKGMRTAVVGTQCSRHLIRGRTAEILVSALDYR